MDQRPIGVFDSGLGGISTLIQARLALPTENFIYFGDSINAPYGNRSQEELERLASNACQFLIDHNAKAILIACNTSSAAALDLLQRKFSLPICGISPAILLAANHVGSGLVLMAATESTVRLPGYRRLRLRLPVDAHVVDTPFSAEVVRRVERGLFAPGSYDDLLAAPFQEFEGLAVQGIVLGCTHYPFIQPEIARYAQTHFQGTPRFFEGGLTAISQLKARLEVSGLLNTEGHADVAFFTSGDIAAVQPLFELLLNRPLFDGLITQ